MLYDVSHDDSSHAAANLTGHVFCGTSSAGTVKATDQKPTQNLGFRGGKKKESPWHCVEGCGACCKLQKGPSYPSPKEIFTNTSDVEVTFHPSPSNISQQQFKHLIYDIYHPHF